MQQAKRIRRVVHIVVAAVPVTILTVSYILTLYNVPTTTGEPSVFIGRLVTWLLLFGLIGLIIASIPGLADYSVLREPQPIRGIANQHLGFGALAFLVFAGDLVSRWFSPFRIGPPVLPVAFGTFGVGFLGYSCYLGYRLMYPAIARPENNLSVYDRMVELHPPIRSTVPGVATPKPQ